MPSLLTQRYQDIETDDARLRRLTGFKRQEFEVLHLLFRDKWNHYFTHFTLDGTPRTRQASKRKNSIFNDTNDALLFGLIYLKGDIRQEQLALSFGIDQPKASKYLALIKRIIYQMIEVNPKSIPKRRKEQIFKGLHLTSA
ncbi:MAG: hypothetical protein R2822_11790 [Spirosomataceae bacterium]